MTEQIQSKECTESTTPRIDALIPELEKLWEDASGRAEYVQVEMIAMDARDLARELIETKRAISDGNRWVPVSERLPERDADPKFARTVLLHFPEADGEDQYNLGYYDPQDRRWMVHEGGGFYEEAYPQPTHWKPLEAPK